MASRIRRHRDPLYNYIYISELERRIIDHPLMNRLHDVHQNATAYLTYHSAHGMRFAHSLGAMHVASRIFLRALQFADEEQLTGIAAAVNELLVKAGTSLDALIATLNNPNAPNPLSTDGLYRISGLGDLSERRTLSTLILFQAIRLSCLVHDIGHPPYSHTTETALRQAIHDYKGHEEIGLKILQHIIDQLDFGDFGRGVFLITRHFSEADENDFTTGKLQRLHNLVHGDLDADRLDYVRRDIETAGLSANNYDLGRLVDAAILEYREEKFEICFTTESLSMLETFFAARSHLYHWMLWHHNVVRTNLGLSRSLLLLLTAQTDHLPAKAAKLREEIRDFALLLGDIDQFELFTDSYLRTRLFDVLRDIESAMGQSIGKSPRYSSSETKQLALLLSMFLRRDKGWLMALWKRPDHFREFASRVKNQVHGEQRNAANWLNNKLDERLKHYKSQHHTEDRWTQERNFTAELEDALSCAGVRVYAYLITNRFDPAPAKLRLKNLTSGTYTPIREISPTIAGLGNAWAELPHLWLFVAGDKLNLDEQRKRTQSQLADFLR